MCIRDRFKALHAVRFRVFAVNCVVSGTLVFCSMLTKLNALPLLAFLPVVSLLKLNTPMDRLPSRSTNIALLHTVAINLLIAPLTIGLMKTWAPMTLKEGALSKIFYLILGFSRILPFSMLPIGGRSFFYR